jgi:hypothetical protein
MRTNRSNYKHTNLFLLRVWCDALVESENGEKGEESGLKWHGRLQRTVSGEARNFNGKDALIEVLESMLYKDRLEHAGPSPNSGSGTNTSSGGNNSSEANRYTDQK